MPFVNTPYHIKEPILAFLWLMRERGCTQAQAQKILDKHRLMQNNRPISKAEKICGDVELSEFVPSSIPHLLHIEPLFYNDDFCLYDKPHNLLTHPKGRFYHYSLNDILKSRFGTHANALHRLDKQTSGLVLCSINPKSKKILESLMQNRAISKGYCAIVEGRVNREILIDKPTMTQKQKGDLSIKSIISQKGKESYTLIRPLAYYKDSTLIYALALTGRTHQIRLHCAYIGHRILGDPLYGVSEEKSRFYLETPHLSQSQHQALFGAPFLCLNAYTLRFSFQGSDYHFKSNTPFGFMPHFQGFFQSHTFL
ncbi:pseudouridine synthase family protein [Helicobacter labetoulli]|uniref:pseudouridine synthase family protein n=1 Tax=Helicobacter labetoulli TaxID=2315333 RepID=UPI000EF6C531|nr:RluA family pseudouridine synthase [Helicobacter labetoulli]